jgi:hypothetical protein
MKKRLMMGLLILFVSINSVVPGLCWWPFGKESKDQLEQTIAEYKDFEEDHNYSSGMLRKIEDTVKGDGKKSLTLRMAYMRLRYYQAVQNEDQKAIQEVSNEAESLLKGDHPLFRQDVRKTEVREFLAALKEARCNEERSYSWTAFIVTCLIAAILALFLSFPVAVLAGEGGAAAFFVLPVLGLIAGGVLYHFVIIRIWYTKTIVYLDIPSVPMIA